MNNLEPEDLDWRPLGEPEEALPATIRDAIAAEEDRRREHGGSRTRKVLVVGGSGYIGVPLIGLLLSRGYAVRNLDNAVYEHAASTINLFQNQNYEHLHGDLCNPEDREKALADISDVVVLAGLVGDPITKKYPEESHAINDIGVQSLIDEFNGKGLNKVIFVSTCSNYGFIADDEIADETHELKPLSLYAKSKVAAEQHLLSLEGKVDYHPTILRFATAFGLAPRMRFDLTVNEFTRDLCLDGELEVYDAHTWRPYCHIRDFARLIDRVLRFPVSEVAFDVFNAGGDVNNHTKQSIVNLVLERLPHGKVIYGEASGDGRNYKVDFSKVRQRLYFEPAYRVEDGIDEIISAIRNHVLDDVGTRRNFYGNYALPGLNK